MPLVAFVFGAFPVLSATFISKEVVGLRLRGMQIRTYAIRKPDLGTIFGINKELCKSTTYILPISVLYLAISQIFYSFLKPNRYFRALLFILTRKLEGGWKDRVRSMLHFAEGVVLAKMIESQGDIVHIHAHYVSHPATLAMVASWLTGIPFSFTAHASDIWVERLFIRDKLAECKFAFVCSKYGRARLLESCNDRVGTKVFVNYHGIDVDWFTVKDERQYVAKHDDKYVLLNIGRISEEKAQGDLIAACNILSKQRRDFRCYIVGDGPLYAKLTALIKSLGLSDIIEMVGMVPHKDIKEYYLKADIFVLPSTRENLPNVLLESLSMGVPVITTDIAGIPELIEDQKTGILVRPGNVVELASAINQLLEDPKMRGEIANRGRSMVRRFFNKKECIDELLELFKDNICANILSLTRKNDKPR